MSSPKIQRCRPLFKATIRPTDSRATFSNPQIDIEVRPGELLWLKGPSGAGKTLTSLHILNIQPAKGVSAEVEWDPAVAQQERCGMLFQQGVLIDMLTVRENIAMSLHAAGLAFDERDIKKHIETVGLKGSDLYKMPNELSGGMLRRVALAQLLAQRKRLIVLDEPFIGLDSETAGSIVDELNRLKKECNTAFILISHQKPYVEKLNPDTEILVLPREVKDGKGDSRLSRTRLSVRTAVKTLDYCGYSVPLIVFAFVAAGFAISMLFADILNRTDIKDSIMEVIDEEFNGSSDNPMLAGIIPILKMKISQVVEDRAPEMKAMLFCYGMAKLFVLELGPLLTALLLAGRIGGSYAGEVGTMQATNQNRLLRSLGVSPRSWSFLPSCIAAIIAAPILTLIATVVALGAGSVVVQWYELSTVEDYWADVYDATFDDKQVVWQTYPPYVLLYRSITFMIIIVAVAETCGRWYALLQPRSVPAVITSAVVISGLLIIFADWGFSQVLLKYASW
eukprot:m.138934 g.138934  ORF g.138934 m.138934 type:complete len:508 (-) comp30025_c0_seq3:144-1667(-)